MRHAQNNQTNANCALLESTSRELTFWNYNAASNVAVLLNDIFPVAFVKHDVCNGLYKPLRSNTCIQESITGILEKWICVKS